MVANEKTVPALENIREKKDLDKAQHMQTLIIRGIPAVPRHRLLLLVCFRTAVRY